MDNTQAYQLGHALGAIVVIVALIAFYFLPTIVAFILRHHYRWPIFVVNLVAGAPIVRIVAETNNWMERAKAQDLSGSLGDYYKGDA